MRDPNTRPLSICKHCGNQIAYRTTSQSGLWCHVDTGIIQCQKADINSALFYAEPPDAYYDRTQDRYGTSTTNDELALPLPKSEKMLHWVLTVTQDSHITARVNRKDSIVELRIDNLTVELPNQEWSRVYRALEGAVRDSVIENRPT